MSIFSNYLIQTGTTQRAIAKAVCASPSYINELVKGAKSPSLEMAFAIERITHGAVPASSWLTLPPAEDLVAVQSQTPNEDSA